MAQSRMHDDEVDTDADFVRRLLASQHPQWAELPIERVLSAGTDNAIYRLAAFVGALQAIDATGGPKHRRGMPVRLGDEGVRKGIAGLRGEVEGDAITEAWNRAMAAPDHDGPPVWFHGVLSYLNLLARDGQLTAVIDWGTCGVGDPAIETVIAWSLFPPEARHAYRDALGVDDATWERGKGWALTRVVGIPYYRDTNPVLVADKVRAIEAVLADSD